MEPNPEGKVPHKYEQKRPSGFVHPSKREAAIFHATLFLCLPISFRRVPLGLGALEVMMKGGRYLSGEKVIEGRLGCQTRFTGK